MRELKDGEQIEIGDIIRVKNAFGLRKHLVYRVTKKYAVVRYNDVKDGRYPRIYCFGFGSIPRHLWDNNDYAVFRK